jgi:type II secretory pathway pseudopilin PulG
VIEILVILGIIGVVAAIGVPSLLSQLAKVRLEAYASDIANLIVQTRQRAITENRDYTVEVDGAIVTGQTLVASTETEPFELYFNTPIEVYPGGIADCQDKYDGSGDSWGGNSLTFGPTGAADDTGAICIWDLRDNILQVVVEFPGKGTPTIRKFLKAGDAPGAGTEGFYEKSSAATAGSTWSWY